MTPPVLPVSSDGCRVARPVRGEGQQANLSGTLYVGGQGPLMPGAGPCLSPGFDAPPLRDVPTETLNAFVVDDHFLVGAEEADLAAWEIPSATAPPVAIAVPGTPTWSAARTARS